MRAILPGQPNCRHQALSTVYWDSKHVTAYVTGNAFTILSDPQTVVQTIYGDTDDELQAIAIDEISGAIATCTRDSVRLYKPHTKFYNKYPEWNLDTTIPLESGPTYADSPTLSWGASQDLLVGTDKLALYSVHGEPDRVWSKSIPNPAFIALLSYDSAYIASVGRDDCLIQIWRRLAFGSTETHFDLCYLPHPDVITNVQWKKPFHVDQTIDNVLYTFCADNFIRMWSGADSHASHQLRLCGKIDVASSIQETSLGRSLKPDDSLTRWACIIDGRDFTAAVEKAVQLQGGNGDSENLPIDHLISVATKSPEICLVLNGSGTMSAWALENVVPSSRGQASTSVFNVAYIDSKEFSFRSAWVEASGKPQHVQIHSYCDRRSGLLTVILQYFDGRIETYTANVVDLFSPATKRPRLSLSAIWSGHTAPISKIVRNYSGSAVVSRTPGGESLVWTQHPGVPLYRQFDRTSVIPSHGHIHRICVLRKGRFVIFLRHRTISLWDCRQPTAKLLASLEYTIAGKPLCLLILPRQRADENLVAHIATVTSEQEGMVWEVKLPHYFRGERGGVDTPQPPTNGHQNGTSSQGSIEQFCTFRLEDAEGLAYVLPVDPAGAKPVVAGFLDIFARDVAISYTSSGRVDFWTARVDVANKSIGWLRTSSTETGISQPALVSGSTLKKAALVNAERSRFTIWDIGAYRLEYSQDFETHNVIKDLDWTSTPDQQSILAVGYKSSVVLLCQMRFDYLNKGPAWAPFREISLSDLTPHPIGDSTWLGNGHLVIGAGNQIFTYTRQFDMSSLVMTKLMLPQRKANWDMFNVVQRLNGPLPVFHPQFLSQCILSGKSLLVRRILVSLHNALKYLVEGEVLDNYLNLDVEEFFEKKTSHPHHSRNNTMSHNYAEAGGRTSEEEAFSEDMAITLNERLTRVNITQLSGHEQIQLADITECLGMVERQRRSLDENGARFLLFFRQAMLRRGGGHKGGGGIGGGEVPISWRDVNWAFHSGSQDILAEFVSRQYSGTMLWENARESAIFSWLSDQNAVKQEFEKIARSEYSKGDAKDPINCSLFYLALKQKSVLRTLWRVATSHPEQRATYKLLSNDFSQQKWKQAAQKNAYALLSKRRFVYAAAFFLLGDSLQEAVSVCLVHLKDLQLAIAIARVYEGDSGPVLRRLLEEEVLPLAAQEGNRWMASWAFWMLKRKDMAVRALVTPVYNLLDTPMTPDLKSQLFLTDDPALVVLYSQLREQTLQTLRGASKVTPQAEWQFVLHSAKTYDRMGCDLLGLDLVRNWEFLRHDLDSVSGLKGENKAFSLMRRRSSSIVADIPLSSLHDDMGAADRAAGGRTNVVQPTMIDEPDPESLLDAFGY